MNLDGDEECNADPGVFGWYSCDCSSCMAARNETSTEHNTVTKRSRTYDSWGVSPTPNYAIKATAIKFTEKAVELRDDDGTYWMPLGVIFGGKKWDDDTKNIKIGKLCEYSVWKDLFNKYKNENIAAHIENDKKAVQTLINKHTPNFTEAQLITLNDLLKRVNYTEIHTLDVDTVKIAAALAFAVKDESPIIGDGI